MTFTLRGQSERDALAAQLAEAQDRIDDRFKLLWEKSEQRLAGADAWARGAEERAAAATQRAEQAERERDEAVNTADARVELYARIVRDVAQALNKGPGSSWADLGTEVATLTARLQDRIDDLELFLQDMATEFPGQEMSRRMLAFLAESE
jgi:hypothetical protein